MALSRRKKLIIPAILSVGVLGGAATCSGESSCFNRETEEECKAPGAYLCVWDEPSKYCEPNCPGHKEQSGCEEDPDCAWSGTSCEEGFA